MAKIVTTGGNDVTDGIVVSSAIASWAIQMDSQRTRKEAAKMLARTMEDAFFLDLHATARRSPQAFHHLYEWGFVGVPDAVLLKGRITPSQNPELRLEFQPSKTPVPRDNDPEGASGDDHIFILKAEIMEYNLPVTIKPKNKKFLYFASPTTGMGIFAKSVTVNSPGGEATTMQLNEFWESFWDTAEVEHIPAIANQEETWVTRKFNKRINSMARSTALKGSSTKTINLGAGAIMAAKRRGTGIGESEHEAYIRRLQARGRGIVE